MPHDLVMRTHEESGDLQIVKRDDAQVRDKAYSLLSLHTALGLLTLLIGLAISFLQP